MRPAVKSIALLHCSNVFMTIAWYAHLKEVSAKPCLLGAFYFVFRSRLGVQ
jgi:uncharacterized protein (DUF486 family)